MFLKRQAVNQKQQTTVDDKAPILLLTESRALGAAAAPLAGCSPGLAAAATAGFLCRCLGMAGRLAGTCSTRGGRGEREAECCGRLDWRQLRITTLSISTCLSRPDQSVAPI